MIVKERNAGEHCESDAMNAAGAKAEEQMAFYLRRAFADTEDVAVFNDLRVRDDSDEVAQFDHLVLHRRGFVVIESKSVTSAVRVNERGEWTRLWNREWKGIPSPVRQAERQVELLKKLLNAHRKDLRDKRLFGALQIGFGPTPFDILVAISDTGRIDRDEHTPPEVHKAEAIVEAVQAAIRRHAKGFLAKNTDDGLEKFSDREYALLVNFLIQRHTPRRNAPDESRPTDAKEVAPANGAAQTSVRVAKASTETSQRGAQVVRETIAPAAAVATNVPQGAKACPECRGSALAILYGRFGYYWKCDACGKSFDIERSCPQCRERTKTRKEGKQFHRDCPSCGHSSVFHVNA